MSLDISLEETQVVVVFDANITHNLTPIWRKAGIYKCLYESDGWEASVMLPMLRSGLEDMRAKGQEYMSLDAANGWGTYAVALPWLEELIAEFKANPNATIRVSK